MALIFYMILHVWLDIPLFRKTSIKTSSGSFVSNTDSIGGLYLDLDRTDPMICSNYRFPTLFTSHKYFKSLLQNSADPDHLGPVQASRSGAGSSISE